MNGARVAVVTGAGRGIGKAIAIALAKENYDVVINSRNPENAKTVAIEIKSFRKKAIGVGGDVAKEEDCRNIIDAAIKQFNRIDVLVNNAGIQKPIPLNKMSVEEWDKVMNVNLRGV
ncbi:MAG: SDR family NAD(P)-dependent oxidoreductase, partial [Nitrososphaerales archaeon]